MGTSLGTGVQKLCRLVPHHRRSKVYKLENTLFMQGAKIKDVGGQRLTIKVVDADWFTILVLGFHVPFGATLKFVPLRTERTSLINIAHPPMAL